MLYNNLTVDNDYLSQKKKNKQILIKIKCYEKTYAYLVRFCISLKNIEPSLKKLLFLIYPKIFLLHLFIFYDAKIKKNI